jgi:hypothetical protein
VASISPSVLVSPSVVRIELSSQHSTKTNNQSQLQLISGWRRVELRVLKGIGVGIVIPCLNHSIDADINTGEKVTRRNVELRAASLIAVLTAVLFGLVFASAPAGASTSSLPGQQAVTWTDSAWHIDNARTLAAVEVHGQDSKVGTSQPRRPDRPGIDTAPAASAACHYTTNSSQSFTFDGATFVGFGHAGYYSGTITNPSKTQVTDAGLEAQCMLARYKAYNPGGIDGVFGQNSQAAMRKFQQDMNNLFSAGLAVDGLPGTHSWPWLRWWQQ